MHIFKLSLLLLLIGYGQCLDPESGDLPEVTGFVLEKGKPIQLSNSYEKIQMAGLNGTLYSDSLSQLSGVKVLRIKWHELSVIEKGALCAAPDLKELEINFYLLNNTIKHITKEMFANCDHLEELLIQLFGDTSSFKIDQDAFEGLVNLKKFVISAYRITHLKKNFFKLSRSLHTVDIEDADIEKVDSDVFENFEDLEKIVISHNKNWINLPKNLFKHQPNLKTIVLKDNGLKNLTWDEFEGLSSVKTLDVSSNDISSFDAEKIAKSLPSLEYISIKLNPIICKQREMFVEELKVKLNHSLEASYKFDPEFYDSCEQES